MANDEFKDKMDDFLDKAKEVAQVGWKKAGEIAQQVGDKTEEIWDATKRKVAKEKLEFAISKKYRELGRAYYSAIKSGATYDDMTIITDITSLYDALDTLNAQEEIFAEFEQGSAQEKTDDAAEEKNEE